LTLNDSRLHVPATNESASVNIQEPVDPLRSLRQLTHLNGSITENWVRIPGFNLVRNDRDNHGGGVLIYYKESLLAPQVTTWDHPNLEAPWLNVTVRSVFSSWLYS
ncbi:unnamed protein product, partial [Pocillopora meandrina]